MGADTPSYPSPPSYIPTHTLISESLDTLSSPDASPVQHRIRFVPFEPCTTNLQSESWLAVRRASIGSASRTRGRIYFGFKHDRASRVLLLKRMGRVERARGGESCNLCLEFGGTNCERRDARWKFLREFEAAVSKGSQIWVKHSFSPVLASIDTLATNQPFFRL